MLLGRGHAVTAETTIKKAVMKKVLKMDPDILFEAWSFFPIVSSMAGTHGNGLHVSNVMQQSVSCRTRCGMHERYCTCWPREKLMH